MRANVATLWSAAKVKVTQTARAVTPFGGLASFIGFLNASGYRCQDRRLLLGLRTRGQA